MKRILYLTLTIMLCLTFFTAVTWAEEKASAASDKILSHSKSMSFCRLMIIRLLMLR